ncbi:MAG: class I SAM-dependent methyltransferase [Candidatus Chisholmbacteria bacterium]|nr:class I SAM-dependent methyltransferase [Candidatus Chisholmbacteria bacterium]
MVKFVKEKLFRRVKRCRACLGKNLIRVMDLGSTPAANAFLKRVDKKTTSRERWFPLKALFCKHCGLVQLEHVVDARYLFKNYVYVSSISPANLAHFKSFAELAVKRFNLKPKTLVVDIGSNDGILLKPFASLGMKILGVEPATNIARRAIADGVPTLARFFNPEVARFIRRREKRGATIITAANVFAHVDDLDELIEGVKILLKDEGVFIIEAPYVVDLLTKNTFDLIYHEHLSHLGVRPLTVLFERLGMKIFDVEHNDSHGGSIRVFVKKTAANHRVRPTVARFLQKEKQLGLQRVLTYRKFAKRILANKLNLLKLLKKLKKEGKTIAGYGAAAKSTTLLHYFGIDNKIVDYVVDDSPYKQDLFTPGTHLPVVPPQRIYTDRPDYLLLLTWNFAEPIMKQHRRFRKLGGKFIVPVPQPKIV